MYGSKIAKGLKKCKSIGGDPLGNFFLKKSLTMPKNSNGDPLVSPGIVCYAEKKKNFFGSVLWANRYDLKFCITFGRTILVTSDVSKKNTDEKP